MACNLTKGFLLDCLEGAGGALEIFLANYDAFSGGITFDATTGEIEDLPTGTVYRYQPLKNSVTFAEVPTNSLENGTSFVAQSLTFRLGGLDQTKRTEIDILRKARVVAFVRLTRQRANGHNYILMMGRASGAFLTGGNFSSGAALGDFNGYELTLTADEFAMAEFLEDYTTVPFDNFSDVTVSPAYTVVS